MSTVYGTGNYNFTYIAYVYEDNANPLAVARVIDFNQYWLPTCYFDGGYRIHDGMGDAYILAGVTQCGQREVPELDLDVSVNWLGDAVIEINVQIVNNYYVNYAPETPSVPTGKAVGVFDHSYEFSTSVIDPEADQVYYQWDWGDGEISEWVGPFNSGETGTGSHIWSAEGTYTVKVKAKDESGDEGPWSEVTEITLTGECGDANGDGGINVGDAVHLLNFIFQSGDAPDPLDRGDANCDNSVNVGDAVQLINHIFKSGPQPGCWP